MLKKVIFHSTFFFCINIKNTLYNVFRNYPVHAACKNTIISFISFFFYLVCCPSCNRDFAQERSNTSSKPHGQLRREVCLPLQVYYHFQSIIISKFECIFQFLKCKNVFIMPESTANDRLHLFTCNANNFQDLFLDFTLINSQTSSSNLVQNR